MRTSGVALAALLVPLVAVARGADGDQDLEVPEAKAALGVLNARIKSGSWSEAFATATSLCEKRGDDLVATAEGVYAPARVLVRKRLAELPAEGRAAAEKLFGDEARKKLEAARAGADPAALEGVADRFFTLDAGVEALILAGDRWLEGGDIPFAVAAWREVAALAPVAVRRAQALKRLEAALPLLGSRGACEEIASQLEGEAAEAIRALARKAPLPDLEDLSVDGSGGVAPLGTFVAPRAASWTALTHAALTPEHDWRDSARRQRALPVLTTGSLGLEDSVVLHLGRSLTALDLKTGAVKWKHEDRRSVRYFAGLLRARASARLGLAHDGGRLYATLQTDSLEDDVPRGRLVALDSRTGKLLWDALESEWGAPEQDPDRETRLSFTGTPLPSGARVFCGAQSAATTGETWITASDSETGRLVWKRRLAVSSLPGGRVGRRRAMGDAMHLGRLPVPVLGVVKGALIVASGNGCLAALDPADGRVLWVRTYERLEESWAELDFAREANPIVAVRGLALVLPPDGAHLLLVRVSDGALADTLARRGDQVRFLLGVANGALLVASRSAVHGVTVSAGEKLEKAWMVPIVEDHAVEAGIGRGVLGRDGLVVPTRAGLMTIDTRLHEHGELMAWPVDRRSSGDLVVAGARVVSIGVLAAAGWGE